MSNRPIGRMMNVRNPDACFWCKQVRPLTMRWSPTVGFCSCWHALRQALLNRWKNGLRRFGDWVFPLDLVLISQYDDCEKRDEWGLSPDDSLAVYDKTSTPQHPRLLLVRVGYCRLELRVRMTGPWEP